MIKTRENFKTYSLSNLYNILKVHESEVKENNKMNFGGPVALISKKSTKENRFDEEAKKIEEGLLLNIDDEVVACYSNNKVKKF